MTHGERDRERERERETEGWGDSQAGCHTVTALKGGEGREGKGMSIHYTTLCTVCGVLQRCLNFPTQNMMSYSTNSTHGAVRDT